MFQDSLFEQSVSAHITISEDHFLVKLCKILDWVALIRIAANIRATKIKREAGNEPHYRQLVGALALMAVRNLTYREAEDQIAHYAPAKYLCDLMESDWSMDHVTIFDFTKMLGPEGVARINEEILQTAKRHGLADPSVLMSDTTAQEAAIPYPNEVGLMNRFVHLAQNEIKKLGGKFSGMKGKLKKSAKTVKGLLRNSHLFAKGKEAKKKVAKKMFHAVEDIHEEITSLLDTGYKLRSKAGKELTRLSDVMRILLPQIRHFIATGFVAPGKVIHLQMPELYSIVRGKAGKKVEFGLKWGINRIGGGFLTGFLAAGHRNSSDKKFCIEGIKLHQSIFGAAPEIFGFDRGGYSAANIKRARKLGVKHPGIAPLGKASSAVSEKMTERIKRERAQVEGSIGSIKAPRYGFNKPRAHTTEAMERCGHRSILGFNLMKLANGI